MYFGILTLIVVALPSITGDCEVFDLPKLNLCRATIKCTEFLGDVSQEIKSWNCIKHRRQYGYHRRYDNEYTYDSNYEVNIELQNVDINKFENPLLGLNNILINNIKKLDVTEGNLVSILPVIYELSSVTEIVIVKNMIEKINLTKLSYMSSLEIVNVSRNAISTIDENEESKEGSSKVHTIDLSYNELELIPNNCLIRFTRLLYLDLSHNLLNKIDLLTFEGIGQVETLLLSHNKLTEIGLNFVRFTHLEILKLDHNYLKALYEINFRTLINLKHLYISFNQLKTIEPNTFGTLVNLEKLDLVDNNLHTISKSFFEKNINLRELFISNNYIDNIEPGVFEGKNISKFTIKGNRLSGTIDFNTFLGIHVEELDLSGGRITSIGDNSFSDMGTELRYLNLSQNSIENISNVCFNNLTVLTKLDLSNNNLVEVEFESKYLKELREFYLQNNRIKKINANMFKKFKSLLILDLSQNAFKELELLFFAELKNLKTLFLNNNDLNSLNANIFKGLQEITKLDIIGTKINWFENDTFYGLNSLENLNISRGQLQRIEYEAFKGTIHIRLLDISFNMLVVFSVNTSYFSKVQELYLNHNKLKNITENTFHKMTSLNKINLSENNILYIHSMALQTLKGLYFFDVSSNTHLKFEAGTFDNLQLSEVSLSNIYSPFNFNGAKNASITTLTLSNCNISNIDIVSVYNIENISKLVLRSNLLTSIDMESFKSMPLLNSLDLSQNMISFIQPGTFLFTDMINTLNLSENKLQSLQFGSLDGLKNVRILNLSSNAIREFNPNLLHNIPRLSTIYLDNNDIIKINFKDFFETTLTTLYIGENPIACEQLTNLRKIYSERLHVTANHLNFNTENVAGIPCITYLSPRRDEAINTHNNSTIELDAHKIIFDDLKKILYENLNETTIIAKTLKNIMTDLSTYQNEFIKGLNKSKSSMENKILDVLNKHDTLRSLLITTSNNVTHMLKAVKNLLELSNNLSYSSNTLSKEQNDLIQMLFHNDKFVLTSQQQGLQKQKNVSDSDDVKVLLIIIAICLAFLCLLIFTFMIYIYIL